MARTNLPLALTLGDPAGIGPDITLLAWLRRNELSLPPFYLLGETDFIAGRAAAMKLDVPAVSTAPENVAETFAKALPVVSLAETITAAPGKPDETSAPAAIASIDRAVHDVFAGRASAIVTNPIAKSVLYGAGFRHPGHTEYLAELAQRKTGKPAMPVMMLWAQELAVVPVTIHIPVADVPRLLTTDLIVETGRIVAREFSARLGVTKPRLAVAGLNPHAGESGTLGKEDEAVVKPAVEALRREGIDARGPLSADTLFHAAARATYDVVLCMYHDQALIPIKTLAFDRGVNITLGLPFVRTSPDHGTAFDIAGSGRADPSSLAEALKLAARLSSSQ